MEKIDLGKDKLIGSLAILKANIVEGKNFISAYIPLVARVLIDNNSEDGISVQNVIDGFESEYGFSIARPAMVTILNKCAKEGIIRKRKNAVYEIVLDKCEAVAINKHDVNMQYQKYNDVVRKLSEYYKSEYNLTMDNQDIESLLMSFLDENSSKTILTKFDNILDQNHTMKQHHYIISKFIKRCQIEDVVTFQLFIDLAVSYLYTSAIAYGVDDEQTRIDAYKDLIIYMDTPFVLRVLGLNGKEIQEAAKAMLNQLYDMNCRFYIFSHTYEELCQVLKDCYKWIEDPQYNAFYASYALRTFVEKKFTKADVQEFIDTLESKLKFYKIQIDDTDYNTGKYYKSPLDEGEIEGRIVQTYREGSSFFDENTKKTTITYDAKSISNVLKLWDKKISRTYKQAKYVLLTTNITLAFVTRQFDEQMNPSIINNVYPCITDVFLGTNMWLGAPVKKMQDFSQKKLLADCMSIIEPSDALIRKLQDSIKKALEDETITEEQYYLLKTRAFSNDYVMQKTLGDEKCFSDTITEELLEDIENEIIQPYQNKIDLLSESLMNERKEKDDAISKIERINSNEVEKKKAEEIKQQEYFDRAEKIISVISNIVFGCIIIPLASTIINVSGLYKVPDILLRISIIMVLLLPFLGWLVSSKNTKIHQLTKNILIKKFKVDDYKKTLK